MSTVSIFISHHKPSMVVQNHFLVPIQVGAYAARKKNGLFLKVTDDSGEDHISAKNGSYCELTAQYWAWKHCQSDYIGFMHYRRHFCFNLEAKCKKRSGLIKYQHINETYILENRLDENGISAVLQQADILIPNKWDVRREGAKNIYDQYKCSEFLHIRDYDTALQVLQEKYPEFTDVAQEYNQGHYGYFGNMFVMRRDLFMAYSAWLFDILFTVENSIDISGYNTQEARVFGHLSERLLGIYLLWLRSRGDCRILELKQTFIEAPEATAEIKSTSEITPHAATGDRQVTKQKINRWQAMQKGLRQRQYFRLTFRPKEKRYKLIVLGITLIDFAQDKNVREM